MIEEIEEDIEVLRKKLISSMEEINISTKMLSSLSNIPASTIYNVMYGKSSRESLIRKLLICVEKYSNAEIIDGALYVKATIAVTNAANILSLSLTKKFLDKNIDNIYLFAKKNQDQENINAFALGVITSNLSEKR